MIFDLPTAYSLSKAAKQLNGKYILRSTPGKVEGIQQLMTEQLRVRIHYLLQANPKLQSRNIRVKITGDGTSISISVHLVVIAFSLLDFDKNPMDAMLLHC